MFLRSFFAFVVIVLVSSAFALKEYSGIRAFVDTTLHVLHHRETIAIVELGRNRTIFTCELIEVLTNEEKQKTLESLAKVIPKKPGKLTFNQMMKLMVSCAQLPEPTIKRSMKNAMNDRERTFPGWGIVPGTKWCGNSDVADNYFDLGSEAKLDACCRMHDICPAKVLSGYTKYDITNDGAFTILHCDCDAVFHDCLRDQGNKIGNTIGTVYFNILGGMCMYSVDGKFALKQKPRY